jgi:hypothetical protein
MSNGQLMVVKDTDYLNPVTSFSVIDNVTQSRVLSISCPDVVAAFSKPGVSRKEVKCGGQIIYVLFGLFLTPLRKRVQPDGLHIVSRFGRETVLRASHAWQSLHF